MLHNYASTRKWICHAGLLALCATTVLAADQTTLTSQTMQPAVVQPNMNMTGYQNDLAEALRQVNEKYQDVQRDLQEEYAKIRQERDENSQSIFERVRQLKEDHKIQEAQYRQDYDEFHKRMSEAKINETDKQFIDQANPFNLLRTGKDSFYKTALANLQRLYRLNEQRYNEMARIHEAKENLEEQRYREKRDTASDRIRLQNRVFHETNAVYAVDPNIPVNLVTRADVRAYNAMPTAPLYTAGISAYGVGLAATVADARLAEFNQQAQQAKARYENSHLALEDLQSLIDGRIAKQRDYLNDHQRIMENIAKNRNDVSAAAKYTEELHDLHATREIEENQYETNLRYLQEGLATEQMSNREIGQIDLMRGNLERRWMEREINNQNRLAILDARLNGSNLTDAGTEAIKTQRDQMYTRFNEQRDAYNKTVKLINDRRSIAEKSADKQRSYLKDRNNLRLKIAESDVNGDNINEFRQEIVQLEEKRMQEERDVRNKIMGLSSQFPAMYRDSSWMGGNMADRRDRRLACLDRRVDQMKERFETRKQRLDEQISNYESRLNDQNPAPADRTALQDQIDQLKKTRDCQETHRQESITKAEERKQLEDARLDARQKYMDKRIELVKQTRAENASYEDIEKINQQLRDMDADWDKQEHRFRESVQPLQSLLPSADEDWRDSSEQRWKATVQRAEQQADVKVHETAAGTVREADRIIRTGARDGETGLRRIGAAIREGYHDVIDYFKN